MNEAFRNDRANELYHICQISADKGVIFYTVWDYIVFFCLLCTNVRRYKVTLVAATLMLNHIHVAFSGNLSEITNCMRTTLSSFSLEYNSRGGTRILHFKKGLNKSQKSSGKKIRSCLVYILNNPVEKNACNKAFEYRWNFLQYHSTSHPFSEEIILRRCSADFRRTRSLVIAARNSGRPIRYKFLETWMKKLSVSERLQMCDFIISSYNAIDYKSMVSRFGSLESLSIALESTTGSDYEIREDLSKENYRHYTTLFNVSRKMGLFGTSGELRFNEKVAHKLANQLLKISDATSYEISRYLHFPAPCRTTPPLCTAYDTHGKF